MTFFSKKVFTPFTVLLICILFAGATFLITFLCMRQKYSVQFSDLYDFAVKDSMVAEAGDLFAGNAYERIGYGHMGRKRRKGTIAFLERFSRYLYRRKRNRA